VRNAGLLLRFAIVGTAGFAVDASVLWMVVRLGCNPFLGRALSYPVAATFTWACNRWWAFGDDSPKLLTQWAKFLIANLFGGTVNYATYAALVLACGISMVPVLGVAAGSLAGLAVNFIVSKRYVFASAATTVPSRSA
jgi:putative flippase GtrA